MLTNSQHLHAVTQLQARLLTFAVEMQQHVQVVQESRDLRVSVW